MTKVIGIAGGIGSGKSVVSRILRLQGDPVYDCDYEARRLMEEPGGELRERLAARLGADIYREDGTLDRNRMAAEIFGDREAREFVNSLVHACVRADFGRRVEEWRRQGAETVYVESAILASSGLAEACSAVLIVDAPEEERVARAIGRGMTPEDARARIAAQQREMEETLSCGRPVRIIDNGPEGESLIRQLSIK